MVDKRLRSVIQKVIEERTPKEMKVVSMNIRKEYHDAVIRFLKSRGIENGFSALMNEKFREMVEEVEKIEEEERSEKKSGEIYSKK
jgi:hypothetical protein